MGKFWGSNAVQNTGGELCSFCSCHFEFPTFLMGCPGLQPPPLRCHLLCRPKQGRGLGSLSWTSAHLAVSGPAPWACPLSPSWEWQLSQPVPKATPSPAWGWEPGPRRTNPSLSLAGRCPAAQPRSLGDAEGMGSAQLWALVLGHVTSPLGTRVHPLNRDGGQVPPHPAPHCC